MCIEQFVRQIASAHRWGLETRLAAYLRPSEMANRTVLSGDTANIAGLAGWDTGHNRIACLTHIGGPILESGRPRFRVGNPERR